LPEIVEKDGELTVLAAEVLSVDAFASIPIAPRAGAAENIPANIKMGIVTQDTLRIPLIFMLMVVLLHACAHS